MPKSIDRPMNITAKATEIRFSEPMVRKAKAKVKTRPIARVAKVATISLNDFRAAKSRPRTSAADSTRARPMPSATVANSSSFSATGPVRRMRTPMSPLMPSAAAVSRTNWVALAPGSRAVKSRLGWARIRWRSMFWSTGRSISMVCQDSPRLPPDRASFSVPAMAESGFSRRSIGIALFSTPCRKVVSVPNRPRRLGSAVRLPMKACASITESAIFWTCSVGR